MIGVKLEGHMPMMRRFQRVIRGAAPTVRAVNRRFQAILLAEARASASGRPGPEVDTGQFLANMMTEVDGDAVVLFNNSPQAERLEFGFVGVDALGRHYAQPPYPWARPTYDRVAPRYVEELGISLEDLANG